MAFPLRAQTAQRRVRPRNVQRPVVNGVMRVKAVRRANKTPQRPQALLVGKALASRVHLGSKTLRLVPIRRRAVIRPVPAVRRIFLARLGENGRTPIPAQRNVPIGVMSRSVPPRIPLQREGGRPSTAILVRDRFRPAAVA